MTAIRAGTIAIVDDVASPRHFAGVDEALRRRGCDAAWIPVDASPQRLTGAPRVVAVADCRSFESLAVLRQARRAGACTVLLMDGIAEYRNTFGNPRAGRAFLRPVPADVVACAGPADARRLRALGNDAVATGLPRLARIVSAPRPRRPSILVATARQPAFGDGERRRLLDALQRLRARLAALGVAARWRLTGGLDVDLGVAADHGPLEDALAAASAVVTSPSTLLIEAMRAGRPAALLFPFDAPCWPIAAWTIGAPRLAEDGALDAVVAALLDPSPADLARQREALARMHQERVCPADAVADLLLDLAGRPRRAPRPARLLNPARLPPARPAEPGRPRVVSLVPCETTTIGGVATWSRRLGRAFAAGDLGYDLRTLLVVTHPDAMPDDGDLDGQTDVCVVDPAAGRPAALATLGAALRRLEPAVVLPNYSDLCYAAATQMRARRARMIAVAHADHDLYRRLLGFYDRWDAAVAVSAACIKWVAPMAGPRPVAQIVCGVPVAARPRRVAPDGPLRIAYVGRMIEHQKRIGDLLALIDGLEARGVCWELDVVGDGEDLDSWRRALSRRGAAAAHVRVHGRRSPEWVERLLGGIDVSVLLSDYEGTSVTMLESMAAGVVPAVTHVSSGVDDWITDGVNGVVVPVGAPDVMAERLARLAADRGRVAAMGRAAWDTARRGASAVATARAWRDLFDAVMPRPMDLAPTDLGLRLGDGCAAFGEWTDEPQVARGWIERALREAGYRSVALDEPSPGDDAVLVRAGAPGDVEEAVRTHRDRGLGVAVWPHLVEAPVTERLARAVGEAVRAGCRRVAIYGTGRHTQRAAELFERRLPLVGFIDDAPPGRRRVFGLPVVTPSRALRELRPDAVVLSSDRWEPQLWQRCRALRRAGVRVIRLYDENGRVMGGVTPPACASSAAGRAASPTS